MHEQEIFVLDAQATLPDGTVQQLSTEEGKALLESSDAYKKLNVQGPVDITITWLEGTHEQILHMFGLEVLLGEAE